MFNCCCFCCCTTQLSIRTNECLPICSVRYSNTTFRAAICSRQCSNRAGFLAKPAVVCVLFESARWSSLRNKVKISFRFSIRCLECSIFSLRLGCRTSTRSTNPGNETSTSHSPFSMCHCLSLVCSSCPRRPLHHHNTTITNHRPPTHAAVDHAARSRRVRAGAAAARQRLLARRNARVRQ